MIICGASLIKGDVMSQNATEFWRRPVRYALNFTKCFGQEKDFTALVESLSIASDCETIGMRMAYGH